MRARQTIADLFSTFIQFDADRFWAWASDAHLQRSIHRCLEQRTQPETSENFWALYWHKCWQSQPEGLAKAHLNAYAQEPCYWAAQKTSLNFSSTQYSLADCFQLAIAQFEKILKGFNAQQGFNFRTYASATCSSLIRESLRQRQEVDICTDWGLLRKLSQKRLVEALQNAGLPAATIADYVLAWHAFKLIYTPTQPTGTRKLPKPEPATWEAIAYRFNRDRSPSGQTALNADQAEKWMLACAKAARIYLYPTSVSINAPKPGQESGEFLDDLPDLAQPSLLAELMADEEIQSRHAQQQQLSDLLNTALSQLDPESQTILDLYYRQGLTQQQMAAALNTKQYTISRRLTRARETLLNKLAHWVKATLHIAPTPDVLKNTSTALEEWLTSHFNPAQNS